MLRFKAQPYVQYRTETVRFYRYCFYRATRIVITPWVTATNYQETVMKHKQTKHQTEEILSISEKVINTQLDQEDIEVDRYPRQSVGKMQTGFGDVREKIKKGHKNDWH